MIWIARIAASTAALLVVYVVLVAIPLDMWRNHKIYKRMRGGVRWWE